MIQNYSAQLFVYLRATQQRSEQLQRQHMYKDENKKRMKTKAKLGGKKKQNEH